ncbi:MULTISPECIES: Card1-like endonuclease domain-containing protein [Nostocales]|uniref:DUF1887 family protein n=3 Tax=Nostocales TaxID=1161 RepID=A0A8S9TCC9_9CYAN|nr:DUF1887 family CARF protein [Tolypothrix bouteillei]KAF3890055.1 DUF1887 family protein [Tolypothrix bouteillei VB521301]
MGTFEFDEYKVDHLFLLIGENPLPNYVAANLLLNEGGTAYLVYSTDTEKSAKRLQDILKSESNSFKDIELRSLNDYESDAYYIQQQIKEKLGSIKSGKVGLNYTGGTKAMSAHSYRALFYEEIKDKSNTLYKRRENIIFSYLDPRRLEICIDREDNERVRLKIKPDTLQVELVKLFQLHGLEFKKQPTQNIKLSKLTKELVKIFGEDEKKKLWFDWYFQIFCEEARIKKNGTWGNWKSNTDLAKIFVSLNDLPSSFVEVLKNEKLLNDEGKLALSNVKSIDLFPEIKDLCKWLDGIWLEHYVLERVKTIANDQFIQYYGMNFQLKLTSTEKFEFDVAFTRGYQLFAISCTTISDRKLCKSKLFEAYLRAKQMGGDEARVALICCFDEPDSLKAEISGTLPDKKIAVFGREHLENLATELNTWINQNDVGTK